MSKRRSFFKKEMLFIELSLIGFLAINVVVNIGIVARLFHYYTVFIPIGVAISIYFCFKKINRLIAISIVSVFYVLVYFRGLITDPSRIFPYSTFLF
jgi:hypothetical protein